MYFNYFYDLVDCEPEEEVAKYYLPIISIIVEETLRFGGSIVHHHGIGKARAPWVREEYGIVVPDPRDAEARVRSERDHEPRDDLSRLSAQGSSPIAPAGWLSGTGSAIV